MFPMTLIIASLDKMDVFFDARHLERGDVVEWKTGWRVLLSKNDLLGLHLEHKPC